MDNRTLVERVHLLQEGVRGVDSVLVGQIGQAIIPLLEYRRRLENATREDLLEIPGINKKNVTYFIRVFSGEEVSVVAKDVPKRLSSRMPLAPGSQNPKETGNWDGSWDNAVSRYEGS